MINKKYFWFGAIMAFLLVSLVIAQVGFERTNSTISIPLEDEQIIKDTLNINEIEPTIIFQGCNEINCAFKVEDQQGLNPLLVVPSKKCILMQNNETLEGYGGCIEWINYGEEELIDLRNKEWKKFLERTAESFRQEEQSEIQIGEGAVGLG